MKIGIHCNQFDGRGTGKVPYDYGIGLKNLLNHEVIYITTKNTANEGLLNIQNHFKTVLYDTKPIHHQSTQEQFHTKKMLEDIVRDEKLDFIYMVKAGENDNVTPENCKSGVHCVFRMNSPHGSVYAGVSEYLAKKFNKSDFVPHIIKSLSKTEDYRVKYNIPKDAFVFGRHGGVGQFNIPFVKKAVIDILSHRKDVYFFFLSTEKFFEHERIIYIPWVNTEQEIFNFIHACDTMLHARLDGETFGLAIGEFSSTNKPVITWSGMINSNLYHSYDKCHLDLLGDRAIIYHDYQDLLDTMYSIDKSFIAEHSWDKYSTQFSEQNVIKSFNSTFLK